MVATSEPDTTPTTDNVGVRNATSWLWRHLTPLANLPLLIGDADLLMKRKLAPFGRGWDINIALCLFMGLLPVTLEDK